MYGGRWMVGGSRVHHNLPKSLTSGQRASVPARVGLRIAIFILTESDGVGYGTQWERTIYEGGKHYLVT